MKIFGGTASLSLAEKVAKELKTKLSGLEIHTFPDEEKRIRVAENVVGEDCVVIQSTSTPADKNYMELFFIVDALKRSGGKLVTAVIPYLGYQRQDHVFRGGEAVSLEVIIKMLEGVGVDKVITFDLHSIKIPELFKVPVIHLSALPLFAEKIKATVSAEVAHENFLVRDAKKGLSSNRFKNPASSHNENFVGSPRFESSVLVSPDMGGIRRIKQLSEMLSDMPYATIEKNRDLKSGKIEAEVIHGEVKKYAIIVDDMISTGSTIVVAADLLSKKGAEEIMVFATHPVFSKDAHVVLQKSKVKKVFVTDTIEVPKEKRFAKLEVISVAETIADILMHPN